MPNAPVVGTPENGERSDQRLIVLDRTWFCGCCARPRQSHVTTTAALKLTLSGASCVLRDGVELNSFAVKLRFHHSPVYPAGVRGADLSFRGADMILMSLNGIKLVVTRLASPARI